MTQGRKKVSEQAEIKFPKLAIEAWGDRQFQVDSELGSHDDFDREHVSFGGFFGEHGPYVFAAAPQLLAACRDLIGPLETAAAILKADGKRLDKNTQSSLDSARATIALTEGPAAWIAKS